MRVAVTGSSGLIGSHLCDALLARGDDLLAIDVRSPGIDGHKPFYKQVDILNSEELAGAFGSFMPEQVVHLAAWAHVHDRRGLGAFAANIQGVRNVARAIRATQSVRRAIFTSSQLVCRVGRIPLHDQDYSPDTTYGESKVLTEQIVREEDGGGVAWCLTRPTTIWGPRMGPHYQLLLDLIRRGLYFHVGSRPLQKSYGYVENTIFQYLQLMSAPEGDIVGRVFYLADYEPLSLRAWIDALQHGLKARTVPTCPESGARVLAKIGDALNDLGVAFPFNSFRLRNILTEYCFDLSETRRVCGPLPFSVEHGIARTLDWFGSLENDRGTR